MTYKVCAAAMLLAAVAVPAASAKSRPKPKHVHVKLSLVALPKTQLGSAASALAIDSDSGVVTNADAAGDSFAGVFAYTFHRLGRVTGYALDYGDEASGASGVDEVWTGVDQYKSTADAKKGLAFWQKDDARLAELNQSFFSVTTEAVNVPRLGSKRFGSLTTYSAANIARVASVDEQFVDGDYLLDITVSAGAAGQAVQLAGKYAKTLDHRLQLALKGKLHAKAVKLPAKQHAGPPAGGPDLTQAALATTDFSSTATLAGAAYRVDPSAVSDYSVVFSPAGPFGIVDQEIEWYANANEASFWGDWQNADLLSSGGAPVDLSAVGDGAQGGIAGTKSGDFAWSSVTIGNSTEYLFLIGPSIAASDLQSLTQTAADKLAPVVGG